MLKKHLAFCIAASLLFFRRADAEGVVLVKDYGAKADDGVSDSAAIASAVAAAKDGDLVLLPAGTFEIDAPIRLKSGIRFSGAGNEKTVIGNIGNLPEGIIDLKDAKGVEIVGLTLDGHGSPMAVAGQGILAESCSQLNLHDLTIRNILGKDQAAVHGIFFAANVTDSVIRHNTIQNIAPQSGWGGGIRLASKSARNQVLDNTIADTGRGGILANDGSDDLIVRDNTITGSGLSKNGEGLGLEIWHCVHALVEHNHIDHWLSLDSADGSAVRDNVVSDKTGRYKFIGLELVASADVVFSRNTVDGGQKLGISESNGDKRPIVRSYFAHNTIQGASTWGIQIQGAPGGACQQYFYANTFRDTLADGPHALYHGQGHGIRFNGDASWIVFDGNRITDNAGCGFQPGGDHLDHLVFINNVIKHNQGSALTHVPESVKNLVWRGNQVEANGEGVRGVPTVGASNGEYTLKFDCPANLQEKRPTQFVAHLIRANSEVAVANLLWDFDDGLPTAATDAHASHTFPRAGEYVVGVVAWDAEGNAGHAESKVKVYLADDAKLR